ncbi:MAG: hypothetical protein PHY04_00525 [Candidatus ainarchaeum sp.]|nr:hypothetical protein [Candidatus ainarchaeum sp.]MDD4467595.1 hypothetical protein [Candidatus ainarchaeum sp.]
MVELYCSWCKGLPESKKALSIIKDSNEFSGIELSNTDNQIDKVLESGLKVSIHNPAREYKISIESPNFIEIMSAHPEIISTCKKTPLPFVSFHMGQSCFYYKPQSKEQLLSNIRKNLNYLNHSIDKRILLEEMSFYPSMINPVKEQESKLYSTSIKLQKEVSQIANAGLLIDLSHTLISARSRIMLNLYKGNEIDYFIDLLQNVGSNIFELHLNSPLLVKNEGFVDKHFIINSAKKESKFVLDYAQEAIFSCPNLKIITLEMEPMLEPIQHAKVLVKQAKLIRKKINL